VKGSLVCGRKDGKYRKGAVFCSCPRSISFHREYVQCASAPNWCGIISIRRERDGIEGGHRGGSHVPLGTSCAVSRGEVDGFDLCVGLVGFLWHEHDVSSQGGCGGGN